MNKFQWKLYNREKVELFQIAGKFYIVKLLGNIFQAKFSTQSFMPEKGFFLRVDRMVRAVTQNKKKMEILAQSKKLFLTNLCHEMIGIFQNQANRVSNAL